MRLGRIRSLHAFALFLLVCGTPVAGAPYLPHASLQREYLTVDGRRYGSDYVHHPQPLEQELTYEKLKALILERQLREIPSVVSALPKEMLDGNYIIMYRSRSLQHASPRHPRVLVFTPTARLILTFNSGDTRFGGHDSIEIIQFRDGTLRFEFREITFRKGSTPQFSGPDPYKCAACHQSHKRQGVDLRPNWEPYNVWPGAIGSHGGSFKLFGKINRDHRITPHDESFLEEQAREPEITREFLELSQRHRRYRHLGRLNELATSDFTDLLAVLNFKRVVRLMKEDAAHFEQSKELIEMLGECETSIPHDIVKFYKGRTPRNRYFDYTKGSFSANLAAIFEGVGIDTSDWSMDFGSGGRLAFYERFGVPSHAHLVFKYSWAVANGFRVGHERPSCNALRRTTLRKWERYRAEVERKYPVAHPIGERHSPVQLFSTGLR